MSFARFDRLASLLFSARCAFFLPYVALYLAAFEFKLTYGGLRSIFDVCHLLTLMLLVRFAVTRLARRYSSLSAAMRDVSLWFWILLVLGFLLPGAYLEFPGDPWEQVWRMNRPRPDVPVTALRVRWFSYFLGWTFLSRVEPVHQRLVLDIYSAFWQSLLALQFYRLAKRFGFSDAWSRVQVLGVIALFGNNVFSFFRYYALSSTPLAYIAYLAAAMAVLDILEGRWREGLTLAAAVVVIRTTHEQELFFLLIFTAVAVARRIYLALSPRARILALVTVGAIWLASFPVGRAVMSRPEAHGLNVRYFVKPMITDSGVYAIWDSRFPYFHTLGAHGALSLVLAVACHRAHPLIASLTLAPVALLLFPPIGIAMSHMTSSGNTYRVLYLLPDSFMLVAAVRFLTSTRLWVPLPLLRREAAAQALAVATLACFGLWAAAPGYGKLRFQYHRPSPNLTFQGLEQTAQWFAEHRKLDRECVIKSDAITEFVVSSFLGRDNTVSRVSGDHWVNGGWVDWRLEGFRDLANYPSAKPLCGFLVVDKATLEDSREPAPGAWVGALSAHWPLAAQAFASRVPTWFPEEAERLVSLGWKKTFVPPFYWYYERTTSTDGR